MPRGLVWAVYIDDNATAWAQLVDADYALDPDRGWDSAGVEGLPPVPRMWRRRRVVGVDSQGQLRRAIIGNELAPLWTGAVGSFTFETNSGSIDTATVIAKEQEFRRVGR